MTEAVSKYFPGMEQWLIVLAPLLLIAYFIPLFIAAGRRHRFIPAIGLINLALGWTVLGWLGAIIWAVNRDVRGRDVEPQPAPLDFMNEPRLIEPGENSQAIEVGSSKKCLYCAESIRAEALVCRYCGHDVGAPGAATPAVAKSTTIDQSIEELQALLKDHEQSVEERFPVSEPATNYVPPQEAVTAPIPVEVARQLSGWKKAG
ncbi:MAG TPA: superinfection immunity protein [Burkholderiales bacterium]|nr:superinfection immunity protein [Burkholderiales bacterium]